MIEKVNPFHPDKVADRIAGAIVDLAYKTEKDPKIAVEVLIGHGVCYVIAETSADIFAEQIKRIVHRIAGQMAVISDIKPQDKHLADNQADGFRCGDNGIFKGMPLTDEEKKLSVIAREIYKSYPCDGKYIMDGERAMQRRKNFERSTRGQTSILSVTGLAARMLIPGQLTESLALIWHSLSRAAVCMAKTYPRRMYP